MGKHRDAEVAKQMDVQVYRLLTDGIPLKLDTRMVLRITGDPREEVLPGVLPGGFEPAALRSPLPARTGPDGSLRLQVRAGNWTVEIDARAAENLVKFSLAAAQGPLPKQEIWSYRSNDRLRVAVIEGAEGIDPSQANVPQDWRSLPSYRVAAGGSLQIVEHSRGALPQETNHLNLIREMYLDFSHSGFTVVDTIDGQMRTGWRLDMRQPFTLAHASLGSDNLLVTQGAGPELTGVEIRSPTVNLSTVARIAESGGKLPATGWNQRFDQVSGTFSSPPPARWRWSPFGRTRRSSERDPSTMLETNLQRNRKQLLNGLRGILDEKGEWRDAPQVWRNYVVSVLEPALVLLEGNVLASVIRIERTLHLIGERESGRQRALEGIQLVRDRKTNYLPLHNV